MESGGEAVDSADPGDSGSGDTLFFRESKEDDLFPLKEASLDEPLRADNVPAPLAAPVGLSAAIDSSSSVLVWVLEADYN